MPETPDHASPPTPSTPSSSRVDDLVQRLTLDEKASLTAGVSLWFVPPVERLGIPSLKVSDGPSGVRGESLTGRRSLSLPCGMAIGSTWNPELVERMGVVLAAEARSKGVNVLLGPTVCIARTPLAGRTFESYSEDPHLTARIAVAYVRGVQRRGVACCIKHYACNDQEHERMTISAEVDERALREIHLVAFEAAIQEAHVWSVMTAYNKVNGVYCCEQPDLLGRILRDEWGFDGLVMSDWFGTHSTGPAAQAGLDLEMPGPSAWLGPTLRAAIHDGTVAESVLDGQVRHMLQLMERVGMLDGTYQRGPEREEDRPEHRAIARAVAAEGTVLLVNDGLLPFRAASSSADVVPGVDASGTFGVSSIAVIGPNAVQMAMGGGSSEVTPHRRRGVVEALSERLPGVDLSYEVGCRIDRGLPSMDMALMTAREEAASFTLEYFDSTDLSGDPVHVEPARLSRVMWLGQPHEDLTIGSYSIRLTGTFTPDLSGPWRLGLESAGRSVLRLDGAIVVDNSDPLPGDGFYGAGSTLVQVGRTLEAGRPYALQVDIWPRSERSVLLGVRIGAGRPDATDEFERAVTAARAADVAVVVVGSNGQWESEGRDRPDLSLPGRQRELVEAVIAANPRTVVVVNAGSPVEMPWAASAGAVLLPWYGGEEAADALADIIVGAAEPTGRLPITLPARVEDGPTGSDAARYPGADGRVIYGEGVFVGYRFYETKGVTPLFAFGHGLSYGDIVFDDIGVSPDAVVVKLVNKGTRPGTEVVQVYVRALDARVERPDRELAAFAKVTVDAGGRETVRVPLGADAYRYWDLDTHSWRSDEGRYEILVGASSRDIRGSATVTWGGVADG
jgi:beta-glucosidase